MVTVTQSHINKVLENRVINHIMYVRALSYFKNSHLKLIKTDYSSRLTTSNGITTTNGWEGEGEWIVG